TCPRQSSVSRAARGLARPTGRVGVRDRGQPLSTSHGEISRRHDARRRDRPAAGRGPPAAPGRAYERRRLTASTTTRSVSRARRLSTRAVSLVSGGRMRLYLASAGLDDVLWATRRRLIDGVLTTHVLMGEQDIDNEREQLFDLCR